MEICGMVVFHEKSADKLTHAQIILGSAFQY